MLESIAKCLRMQAVQAEGQGMMDYRQVGETGYSGLRAE
jgi:hypothetical protein